MPLGWIAGAAVVGDVIQGYEASQAGSIAGTQLSMEQTTFSEQQGFEKQLAALIANPSSVTSLPGYNFQLDQGTQAVARGEAAGGFLNSGNEAAALTQYGQGLASSFYTTQANLLASLAGLAPASPAQYGNNATNANASASSQWNNMLGEMGMFAGLYGGGMNLGTNSGITPGEQMWLLSGSPGGPGATMPAGGGYTYNTPGYTGQ